MNRFISVKDKQLLRVGIGTSGFGGYFGSDKLDNDYKKEFVNFISNAYDYGIRIIDTAESYASGVSEKLLGLIPKSKKNDLFIISKFNFFQSDLKSIEENLDNSLKRLDREFIDLYMPHWPFPEMNLEELFENLNKLKAKGKINHIGLSNFENYFYYTKKYSNVDFYESELNPYYLSAHKIFSSHLKKTNSYLVGYAPFKQGIIFNRMSKVYNFYLQEFNDYQISLSQFVLFWMLSLSDYNITIPKSENISRIKEFVDLFNLDSNRLNLIKKKISSLNFDKIIKINVNKIRMIEDGDRPIYYNLDEALENRFNLYPNVLDIAKEIKNNNGKITKPIRLIRDDKSQNYFCLDGRLKYWAWVFLYGQESKISSVIY